MTCRARILRLAGLVSLAGFLLGPRTPVVQGAARSAALLEIPAEVRALRDSRVPAEVAGRVVRRPDDETAAVHAGDVVVTLDDALLEPAARSAEAVAARAAAHKEWAALELARVQALFDKGTTDQSELDRTRLVLRESVASMQAAAADARLACARLERSRIRAPFDGRLVTVPPQLGEYLRPGQTAFRIVDLSTLRLLAYLTARQIDALQLHPGVAVEVEAEHAARGERPIPAVVSSIASAAEGAARTFRIEVRIPGPGNGSAKKASLRPGMRARLRLRAAAAGGR